MSQTLDAESKMPDTWPNLLSLRGARFDASGQAHFEPPVAPPSTGLIPLLHEASILVRGEDAESFLQGQLSNDIEQVSSAHGQLAAYCTPKGRVLATFSVWPHDNGYILRLPAELAEGVRKRLQMYVLRSRVLLEDISGDVALLGLVGAQSVPLFREQFGTAPGRALALVQTDGMSALALPGERVEIAVNRASAGALWDRLVAAGCTPAGQDLWDIHGIAAGAATVLASTSDQFIPQMLNLELLGAVAFDKGCYPGQEIVARTQYRGQVKRRLYRFASSQSARPGAPIHASNGSVAGTVMNLAEAPGGGYELLAVTVQETGSGQLYLEVGDDGSALRPLPLPYELPQVEAQSATDAE